MAGLRCDTCHARFTGEGSFDKHRAGEYEQRDRRGKLVRPNARRCLSASEMRDKGMTQTPKGLWTRGVAYTGPAQRTA